MMTEMEEFLPDIPKISPILERLRKRMKEDLGKDMAARGNKRPGNQNGRKDRRRIEIGWMVDEGSGFRQVRSRFGGGVRKDTVHRSTTCQTIQSNAIKLFYPHGQSSKGKIDEFLFKVTDFSGEVIEPDTTVEFLYEEKKVSVLRLYLAAKKRTGKNRIESQETLNCTYSQVNEDMLAAEDEAEKGAYICVPDMLESENVNQDTFLKLEEPFKPLPIFVDPFIRNDSENAVFAGSSENSENDVLLQAMMETGVYKGPLQITLHRGQVFEELIKYFSNPDIELDSCYEVEMIMPNGVREKADDSGGVFRDSLSEFWSSFYEKCSGNQVKTPCLSHRNQKTYWEAVAKVLIVGYNNEKYFPYMIALPFLENALGNVDSVTDEEYITTFLRYIPEIEREMLEKAMSHFVDCDFEEILEVLDSYHCKTLPTEGNIKTVIKELAQKEFVQVPAFVAECWNPLLSRFLKYFPGTRLVIQEATPTVKKVLELLLLPSAEGMNSKEREAVQFLKKFIKDISVENLCKFIRFVTGSDVIVGKQIAVRLVESEGFLRRPIAHTCGCVLELPIYTEYIELRQDFLNILNSSVWVMDLA